MDAVHKATDNANQGLREEKMHREQSEDPPVNLRSTHFERAPKGGYLHYGLEGCNSHEKFYYHVGVVRMDDGELKVSRASGRPI